MKKSEWGISDIDFSKTYITIYKANDTGYFFEPFGDKIYLAPQATQTITLPANDYPAGFYKLDLTVTTKASGKAYTFSTYDTLDYNNPNNISIFVDPTEASQNLASRATRTLYTRHTMGLIRIIKNITARYMKQGTKKITR